MPNAFNYFDPDDDDLDEYEPNSFFRSVAVYLLVLMATFSVLALISLFL